MIFVGAENSWVSRPARHFTIGKRSAFPLNRNHRLLLGNLMPVPDVDPINLLDEVLVLVAGEMGRTPIVNGAAGRGHWTTAYSVLIAGGGLTRRQVLGSTSPDARYPASRPVTVRGSEKIKPRGHG